MDNRLAVTSDPPVSQTMVEAPKALEFSWISSAESTKFVKVVSEVTEKIRALGRASRLARHLPPHSIEGVAS